jgi:hypothetical protein
VSLAARFLAAASHRRNRRHACFLSYVLLDEESWFLKPLIAAVILLGLIAVVLDIRNVINPEALFAVTNRGILMFMEGGGVRLASPFFVPWERVESMQYQVRKATDANGDRLTRKTSL